MAKLSDERKSELLKIVGEMVQPGKGFLAADETPMAMEDRFKGLDIENTAEVSGLPSNEMVVAKTKEICHIKDLWPWRLG